MRGSRAPPHTAAPPTPPGPCAQVAALLNSKKEKLRELRREVEALKEEAAAKEEEGEESDRGELMLVGPGQCVL